MGCADSAVTLAPVARYAYMLPTSVRQRGQLLPIGVVVIVVVFTMANAAANMLPVHRPTAAELRTEERRGIVADRRARIAELQRTGDRCQPAIAHELVRALVLDGAVSEAHRYANDYEQRCGADPVVRGWGDAPRPRPTRGS